MEIDYKAIGLRIKRFREDQQLTQQSISEMTGLAPTNVSHIERGATKASLPSLVKIANALGVTMDDLLCDSLTESRSAYERMAGEILADCSHRELKIITETMLALRESLREKDE